MKKIIAFCTFMFVIGMLRAQRFNWQNLDLAKDLIFGISTEKAYLQLLKNKKATTVIVAIIDSGIDTAHEDLKSVLWTDAKTGIHGWSYIGSETGREDVTNLVVVKKDFYDSLSYSFVPEQYQQGYQTYRRAVPELSSKIEAMEKLIADLEHFNNEEAKQLIALARQHLEHGLNINNIELDTASGDPNVTPDKIGPLQFPNLTPIHGTHVAGIIGAVRGNRIGIDGIADHVQLMMLKTNGNIRELRDRNLAKAIRFAVDHGVKVINLSFGKPYSWEKSVIDDAIEYAVKYDVLLVHAAGNSGEDLDYTEHYPNPLNKATWIEVGASNSKDDVNLVAYFSNYGKQSVDVFAPGVDINSTIPENGYSFESGTSMAAPVVAGLACLIREYYPKLTAVQVKEIILKSVVKVNHNVMIKINGQHQSIPFSNVCVAGGIVNAYNALLLAAEYK